MTDTKSDATGAPREGSLDAPTRHPIDWRNPDFYDAAKIEAELTRVFDICHGCRRCFNLCDSFPRLFDMVDESETGELDSVDPARYGEVVEACTLCDMCFMTKCPYVPPHEFDLDFPHLMLRARAAEAKRGKKSFTQGQLARMDRNGSLAAPVAGLVNWAGRTTNGVTRPPMEAVLGIDARAELPKFHSRTFTSAAKKSAPEVNIAAPAYGRKAVLYATCFVNYNGPQVGHAARAVLAHNGVETEIVYPACCGMPYLEGGEIEKVAGQAQKVAGALIPWIDKGYDVIALTASCGLMMKFEWPLILPEDENIKRLAAATCDIDEYIVGIAKKEGLADGLRPVPEGVAVHLACHARAQNMGPKAAEMLRLLPETKVEIVERCSGHGGTFGVMKKTHELARKVGKPAVSQALRKGVAEGAQLVSDCPLAAKHLMQLMRETAEDTGKLPEAPRHPVEIIARAYGLQGRGEGGV
jgi:glycerol-3-phosphate dehydrogenase subunit C